MDAWYIRVLVMGQQESARFIKSPRTTCTCKVAIHTAGTNDCNDRSNIVWLADEGFHRPRAQTNNVVLERVAKREPLFTSLVLLRNFQADRFFRRLLEDCSETKG